MEAKELRIGNLVYYLCEDSLATPTEWNEVSTIDVNDLVIIESGISDKYSPIPLTAEWLLKFGFEENNKYFTFYIRAHVFIFLDDENRFGVAYENEEYEDCGGDEEWFIYIPNIDFVHQLQNLFFALTGKEIKLP
jgi:hypothetical protein